MSHLDNLYFGAAFDTAAAVMSEEALAEREHTRTGFADGLANGDTAIDMDGHANGANGVASKGPSKKQVV